MTKEHTPTPWHVYDTCIFDADNNIIMKTSQRPHAAHIVKCVNMYDELVLSLDLARIFIESQHRDPSAEEDGEFLSKDARKIHNLLCESIAKAGAL